MKDIHEALKAFLEKESFNHANDAANHLHSLSNFATSENWERVPVEMWNHVLEKTLTFLYCSGFNILHKYNSHYSVLTVGLKLVTRLSYTDGINWNLINKVVTMGWDSFSANPDIDVYVLLGKHYMQFHKDKHFRVDRMLILTGVFASGELDDIRAIIFTDVITKSEAVSYYQSFSFLDDSFVSFVKDTLLNQSFIRAMGCMEFLLLLVEECKEHRRLTNWVPDRIQPFSESALVCLQRNDTNPREQCIIAGMCYKFCYNLGSLEEVVKMFILSKLHIMKLMEDVGRIYQLSSSSSDTMGSFSIEREFNVIFVLNFLDLLITSDCLSEETRLRNSIFCLTHIPTLQQLLLVNDCVVQKEILTLITHIFSILPPLKESHIQQYLGSFFSVILFAVKMIKSSDCIMPLIDLLVVLGQNKRQPLYKAFTESPLYAFLVCFCGDPSIQPFLKVNAPFTEVVNDLITSSQSSASLTLKSISTSQNNLKATVMTITDFLHERDRTVVINHGKDIIHSFNRLTGLLKVLDIGSSSMIISFLLEILQTLNDNDDSELVCMKWEILTTALFGKQDDETTTIVQLTEYLHSLLHQKLPSMEEYYHLTKRNETILFKQKIILHLNFKFSNAIEPAFSIGFEETGVCSNMEFTTSIINILLEKPVFSFLKNELIEYQQKGNLEFDVLRYYYHNKLIEFDYCLYRTIIKAMLAENPKTSLIEPFRDTVTLDVIVLQPNEIGEIPMISRLVNRTVDVTPIEKMDELSQIPSLFYLSDLKGYSARKEKGEKSDIDSESLVLLEFLRFLCSVNHYLEEYLPFLVASSLTPFLTEYKVQSVPFSLFLNRSLTHILHQLLQNSCIVMGRLLPEWLCCMIDFVPHLFSLDDRIAMMNSYAFDSTTSFMSLYNRRDQKIPFRFPLEPPLMRLDVIRDNVLLEGTFVSTMISKCIDVQVKFLDEDGIGTGPTKEFITLLSKEIQRRELHLWNEMDQEPFPFYSVLRMMNHPVRGPGEGVVLNEVSDEIDGAVLRCFKCACFNMFCCPEHHCFLSIDRSQNLLFCRECDYQIPINTLRCDNCNRPSSSFQLYWFSFFRKDLQSLFDWFDANPNDDCCYFGSILCGICSHASLRIFSHTESEALNSQVDPKSEPIHYHRTDRSFMCMLRSMVTRRTMNAIRSCLLYTKPCKLIDLHSSVDPSTFQYTHSQHGLMPAPLLEDTPYYEDTKTLFFTFGTFLGMCLRWDISMNLNLNPLFLSYIHEGIPSLCSIEGALALISLFSPEQYHSFSRMFELMKTIQQGHHADIESLMLDCSLPGYPDVNLLPEYVDSPDCELKEEYYPLWLSRYVQYYFGYGVQPVVSLIHNGMESVIDKKYLRMFTASELSLLLFGERVEWSRSFLEKSVTYSQGYSLNDPYISDFIDVVIGFSKEEQERLLMFITGQRKTVLQNRLNGEKVFSVVEKINGDGYTLPTSSTCLQQLHLPRYESKEVMRKRLLLAINEGYEGLLLV